MKWTLALLFACSLAGAQDLPFSAKTAPEQDNLDYLNGLVKSLQKSSPIPTGVSISTAGDVALGDSKTTLIVTRDASGRITSISTAAISAIDPPGVWTCTVRSGSASAAQNSGIVTSAAACTGNEKVISGGCEVSNTAPVSVTAVIGYPTGQGWTCNLIGSGSGYMTTTAHANCCL